MPAGVASAGVTMDERLRNLMRERGHSDFLLEADDPDLESKLEILLPKLLQHSEEMQSNLSQTVVNNLKSMARMGVYFQQHLINRYPEFPIKRGLLSWENYLPTLNKNLVQLIEKFEPQSKEKPPKNQAPSESSNSSRADTSLMTEN